MNEIQEILNWLDMRFTHSRNYYEENCQDMSERDISEICGYCMALKDAKDYVKTFTLGIHPKE